MKTRPCFLTAHYIPALLAVFWTAPLAHSATMTSSNVLTSGSLWSVGSNWDTQSAPNAIGAVATFAAKTYVRQDVAGGVTLGTLNYTGGSLALYIDNDLIFNQDSTGSGVATIDINGGTGGFAKINSGTGTGSLVVNDDLVIKQDSTTSTVSANGGNGNYALKLTAPIKGSGSITFSNVLNDLDWGMLGIGGSSTSYTGNVTIAKGAVAVIGNNPFGAGVVTLGTSGGGSVSLITHKNYSFNNNIVVAANTGGTSVLGSTYTTNAAEFISGSITLNQNLTVISQQTTVGYGVLLSGTITGAGGLNINGHVTVGGVDTLTSGNVMLSGSNTFTGDTRVINGTLLLGGSTTAATTSLALQYSTLNLATGDAGTVVFGTSTSTAVNSAVLGGLSGSRDLALQNINTTVAAVALSVGKNNTDTTYTGALTGAGSLTKIGTGNLTLGGANTYTGLTSVSSGALQIGNGTSGSIASGTISVASGATLAFNQADGVAYSGTIGNNGTVKATSAYKNTLSGNIGGTGGFTQAGTGTTTLSGYNTYSGATNVTSGLLNLTGTSTSSAFTVDASAGLKVNGSLNGTVTSAGMVSGTGSISGATVITGTLAPGNSVGTIQTGNLTLAGGSTLSVELGRNESNVAVSDLTSVNGTVTLTGANLQLQVYTGYTNPLMGDVYFLINNDGNTDAIVGTFTTLDGVATTLTDGSRFTWNSQEWEITYTANYDTQSVTGGNDLAIIAVPEPSTWAMVLGGLVSLIAGQRLRRRND